MDSQSDAGETKPNRTSQSFFSQMFQHDNEPDPVSLDHCYSKPWNGHPDSLRAKPAKMLFMKGIPFHPSHDPHNQNIPVDVHTVTAKNVAPIDGVRAQAAMNECDRFASSNTVSVNNKNAEDWEETLKKLSTSWTVSQTSFFNKMLKIIQSDRLSRLAYEGTQNEPILRRLAADKSGVRARHLFGSIGWDMKQMQWLHHIFIDNLDKAHLAAYLEILQTLKAKVPSLIDKLLVITKTSDHLQNILKRPWDPVANLFTQQKLRKLPGSPIMVLCPGNPPLGGVGHSKRLKFWHNQLCALGKVVTLNLHISQNMGIRDSLETVMITVKNKITELKETFPLRPIVLVGWTVGAVVACQVALIEGVSAIVCLGFPLTGVLGSRGDLDDPLLEGQTPTLFVVGQNACTCSVDDIEDFRERMRAESGLVVIGGADDYLRINRMKRRLEGVTQSMVDRCILDEVGDFLCNVLTQPLEESPQFLDNVEKTKKEPKTRGKKKEKVVKEVKTPKRQYNRKTAKNVVAATTERLSPSSPGSSTTDTSSTCSFTENTSWKQPKRGVGRPSALETYNKRKRMKLAEPVEQSLPTPLENTTVTLSKRTSKPPEFLKNYLTDPQHMSLNIGSGLGSLRTISPSTPTIPSAAGPPKLGPFEAPRGFIARMDSPQVNVASTSNPSPMSLPRQAGKPKNVTFVTVPNVSNVPMTSTTIASSPSIICSSMESMNTEMKPQHLVVQKKLIDINQFQSLIQKSPKGLQPLQLLGAGTKSAAKLDSPPFLIGSSQSSPKTSLLQSALSMSKNMLTSTSTLSSQPMAVPRKMQVITFLKPPPSTTLPKPILISSASEREMDKESQKGGDPSHPKVMRTYGDVKLNRQLAALKQQQQVPVSPSVKTTTALTDSLSHLSSGTQDAVFALAQLSAGPQISSQENADAT